MVEGLGCSAAPYEKEHGQRHGQSNENLLTLHKHAFTLAILK